MSIGLLRVLLQSQTITNAQAEHYGNALKSGKEILPMLFADGIISPRIDAYPYFVAAVKFIWPYQTRHKSKTSKKSLFLQV